MMNRVTMLLVVALCVVSVPVNGMLINIDAGPSWGPVQSGAAVVGDAGDVWNGVDQNGATGLVDAAGNATTVSFSTSYGNSYNKSGSGADAAIKPLVQDYFWANSKQTVTIGGLNAGDAFTLYVYAGEAGKDGYGGEWSIDTNGDGWGDDPKVVVLSQYASAEIPFPMSSPANYAMLSGTVSAAGTIDIVGWHTNGWVNLMGMQLEVVPEPATLALMGLGGLLLRKRR